MPTPPRVARDCSGGMASNVSAAVSTPEVSPEPILETPSITSGGISIVRSSLMPPWSCAGMGTLPILSIEGVLRDLTGVAVTLVRATAPTRNAAAAARTESSYGFLVTEPEFLYP